MHLIFQYYSKAELPVRILKTQETKTTMKATTTTTTTNSSTSYEMLSDY